MGTITATKENIMQNGLRHEVGGFAPETAVGTGAKEPLVDEYEAAKEVPSVDESVLGEGGRSQNGPETDRTIAYSGDDTAEDANPDEKSTGEDYETRNVDDDTLAGAAVVKDDPEVNKPAEEVRPEVPQAPKRTRKAAGTV